MPFAVLLTVVGLTMSAGLVPVVLNQLTATRVSSARTEALHAAQAGLDAAMGQIRHAVSSAGNTDPDLPPGPLTASVAPDGGERYRVTIEYRDLDGNPLSLPVMQQPGSAVLTSIGIAGASGPFDAHTTGARTLQATYTFRLTSENTPGGRIHVGSAAAELCLDAGSARPAPGDPAITQQCSDKSQQVFAYHRDLTIALVSSPSVANPVGMCLDAGTDPTNGKRVTLQPCTGSNPAPARQQWRTDAVGAFFGTTAGGQPNGVCLKPSVPDQAGPVVLGSGAGCGGSGGGTFRPETAVGAGAAGPATGQLVNFQQFARCLRVAEENLSSLSLTAWPCAQESSPSNVPSLEKWTLPEVDITNPRKAGKIYFSAGDGREYCLQVPATPGAYPTVTHCTGNNGLPPDLTWTVYGDTGTFATSYRIVAGTSPDSSTAQCLAADPATPPAEVHSSSGPSTSRIVLRACDGSTWQKWNAPAYLNRPSPLEIHEPVTG
jgi:hypothetical protein